MVDIFKTITNTLTGQSATSTGATGSTSGNPYEYYYKDNFGYVFGKPLAFNLKADPHQRIYQRTLLKNSTIINIVPGVPHTDTSMISKAKDILEEHERQAAPIIAASTLSESQRSRLAEISANTQQKLLKAGCDLRYFTFKQDLAGFSQAFQMILQRAGAAIFGWSGGSISRMIVDSFSVAGGEDVYKRGFKLWTDKATTISESVENSFAQSILEQMQKKASNAFRQAQFMGGTVGIMNKGETAEYTGGDANMQTAGNLSDIAGRSVSGAVFQFPQVYDDSKFNRSYDISFKFVSPYGDDRSIYYNVIMPFMFILALALPRQDGISGFTSPYIIQIDAPGHFSCPMGVISSLSFNKGGDEKLFNNRGLPLVIEGSFSVVDLYNNLSLPSDYTQFATNLGTAAFLSNIGGLSLYATLDPSVSQIGINYATSVLTKVSYPWAKATEEVNKVRRYFGLQ